jgi:hypothetical protein
MDKQPLKLMDKNKAREIARKGILRALHVGLESGAIEPATVEKTALAMARPGFTSEEEKEAILAITGEATKKRRPVIL